MSATLADGTATGVEVYVGQVWAIIGGVLIATGLLSLALSLVLAVARSLVPSAADEIIAWSDVVDDQVLAAAERAVVTAGPAVVTAEPTVTQQTAEDRSPAGSESAPQR